MLMLNCEGFWKYDCFDFSSLTFKYSDSRERMFPCCWKMDASIHMRLKREIFHAQQNSIFHFFLFFIFSFSSVCGVLFPPRVPWARQYFSSWVVIKFRNGSFGQIRTLLHSNQKRCILIERCIARSLHRSESKTEAIPNCFWKRAFSQFIHTAWFCIFQNLSISAFTENDQNDMQYCNGSFIIYVQDFSCYSVGCSAGRQYSKVYRYPACDKICVSSRVGLVVILLKTAIFHYFDTCQAVASTMFYELWILGQAGLILYLESDVPTTCADDNYMDGDVDGWGGAAVSVGVGPLRVL